MDIVILSLGMPFDGETIYKGSLGGSETAAYYQARELHRRGHRVAIYSTIGQDSNTDGVNYVAAGAITQAAPLGERFEHYERAAPKDVLIVQRASYAFHKRFPSKVNIWQTHDLALHRYKGQVQHGLWAVDAVTCVSEWHRQQTLGVYDIQPEFVKVVPNGVDLSLYEPPSPSDTRVVPPLPEKVRALAREGKFLLLYQARPERGMEHLVRPGGIMSRLLKEAPSAHLVIVGYENTQPAMREVYEQWFMMARQLPNVTVAGALTKPALAQLQMSCDLMVYPTEFEEVSCISAMESMAAGLPLLASACGALPETCAPAGIGVQLLPLKDGRADEDAFVERIAGVSAEQRGEVHTAQTLQLDAAQEKSWSKAVDALETVIEVCFEKRCGSYTAQLRHCIEHGDIMLAKELQDDHADRDNPIEQTTRSELTDLYAFTGDKHKFAAHYRKHQAKYYDEFEERVIGEDVTSTTRFQGVAGYLKKLEGSPRRALDYGCAHGHYLIPFAEYYQDWRFVGVDISARAIAAATKWSERDKVQNASFFVGDEETLSVETLCPYIEGTATMSGTSCDGVVLVEPQPFMVRDLFDVIYAGEVLEHSPDPIALLNQFLTVLKPGGTIIGTVPFGRWEWSGHEAFKTGREHLWHFEKTDLEEMCAHSSLSLDISCAPAGHDETGAVMGSWVFAVTWDGTREKAFQPYDRERKLKYLAPRQTISAALIVKDGERTLRRALDSVAGWVDEVVLGIDPATSDATRAVAERWREANPWTPLKVIDGLEALKEGFAAARNRTIDACAGHWVLWFDADEEVQRPGELWKLARMSSCDGFGFPQVHYAFDPPAVLTTDFPCRFFRREGIRFHGLVHEHPESEPGKAIEHAAIRHDTQFLHSGYATEKVRRDRFMRNLPLLQRERKENPARGLNRFLWLRDIAQGIGFELEQTGGRLMEGHLERAQAGVELYEQIIDQDSLRLMVASLEYYSHCVAVLGIGFEAKFEAQLSVAQAPDLNADLKMVRGRFHTREFFFKVMRKILEESTKFYEDKYL